MSGNRCRKRRLRHEKQVEHATIRKLKSHFESVKREEKARRKAKAERKSKAAAGEEDDGEGGNGEDEERDE